MQFPNNFWWRDVGETRPSKGIFYQRIVLVRQTAQDSLTMNMFSRRILSASLSTGSSISAISKFPDPSPPAGLKPKKNVLRGKYGTHAGLRGGKLDEKPGTKRILISPFAVVSDVSFNFCFCSYLVGIHFSLPVLRYSKRQVMNEPFKLAEVDVKSDYLHRSLEWY